MPLRLAFTPCLAFASHGYTLPSLLMTLLSAAPLCRISALPFLLKDSLRFAVASRRFSRHCPCVAIPLFAFALLTMLCLCLSLPVVALAHRRLSRPRSALALPVGALPLLDYSLLRYAVAMLILSGLFLRLSQPCSAIRILFCAVSYPGISLAYHVYAFPHLTCRCCSMAHVSIHRFTVANPCFSLPCPC